MTKTLPFDLDFAADGKITPVSSMGKSFLTATPELTTIRQIYQAAVDRGLHVRFATLHIRDSVMR